MRPYFFLGNGRGLTRLASGEVFFVDTDSHDITTWILLGGVWETFVDDILCALARPGDVVLDVGANMGYYTVKLAGRVGEQGRVFSFEPNPRLVPFVRDNLRINGWADRGVVTAAAAGAEAGWSFLTFDPGAPGGGQVGLDEQSRCVGQERIAVEVVRIDDVAPPDLPVHLIKIDVEGFEPLALRGAQAVLARSPDAAIVLEVNPEQWARHGDPAEILRRAAEGRRLFRIGGDGLMDEVDTADIGQALSRIGVSYVLLLPATEERWGQVRRFVRGQAPPAPAAQPVVAPPQRPGPGLFARIRRRLAAIIAP